MVEKVVFDNFFHHFNDSKDFLGNSWKKWKSCQKQLLPRFGPPKRLESWKKLARPTFSTFPRIPEEVLFTKMVEKVVFDNFFHHFYDSEDFLRNSWKSGKSCQKQLLHRFGPPKRLESWKKLFLTTFSTIFMIPKTSSEIRGKSGKSCQKQHFQRFGPPKRLESWKKLFLTTFSTIFMIPKTSSTIRGKSGKSCQKQHFPRFGPPKRLESWKKLFLTTFSATFMVPKTSSTIRGKSGKSCQNQLFPRLKLLWRPKSWKKLVLPTIFKIFATKFMETIGFRAGSTAKT